MTHDINCKQGWALVQFHTEPKPDGILKAHSHSAVARAHTIVQVHAPAALYSVVIGQVRNCTSAKRCSELKYVALYTKKYQALVQFRTGPGQAEAKPDSLTE